MGKNDRGTVPDRERIMKVSRAACMSEAFALKAMGLLYDEELRRVLMAIEAGARTAEGVAARVPGMSVSLVRACLTMLVRIGVVERFGTTSRGLCKGTRRPSVIYRRTRIAHTCA